MIKGELSSEYKGIVEYSTNQVNHYQNTFRNIFSILIVIVGVIGYIAKIYIDNIFEKVKEKEEIIQKIQDVINKEKQSMDKQFEIIEDMSIVLKQQINEIKEIEEKIKSQDNRIYNDVMKTMTNYWFDRVEENPSDREKLHNNFLVLDPDIVRQREKNYDILCDIKERGFINNVVIYQFFPDKLFQEKQISQRPSRTSYNYPSEIITGTKLIFEFYNNNKEDKNYHQEMQQYLTDIWESINNTVGHHRYGKTEKQLIKEFIDNNIENIGEQEMREHIKNPPKVEIIEGKTTNTK